MKILRRYNLQRFTFYNVNGGFPDVYIVESEGDFKKAPSESFLIGKGSNTLVVGKLSVPVLKLGITDEIASTILGDAVKLMVPASLEWDRFVVFAVSKGLYGAENLSGIPGTTGAAIRQNIGAYGSQLSDIVDAVDVWDIQERRFKYLVAKDLGFGYRTSLVKQNPNLVVYRVYLTLTRKGKLNFAHPRLESFKSKIKTLRGMRRLIKMLRRKVLPDVRRLPNTGSFFMNPVVTKEKALKLLERFPNMLYRQIDNNRYSLKAGWLIDKAGLKGYRYRRAQVWIKNALVLVNLGDPTGYDVYTLARIVRDRVYDRFGVILEPEVVIVGERTNDDFNKK